MEVRAEEEKKGGGLSETLSCLSLWLGIGNLSRGCPLLLAGSGLALHFWWYTSSTACVCVSKWLHAHMHCAWLPPSVCVHVCMFGHMFLNTDTHTQSQTHTRFLVLIRLKPPVEISFPGTLSASLFDFASNISYC